MQLAVTHRGADFDALASIVAATLLYPGLVALCPKKLQPNVQSFMSLHKTAFNLTRDANFDPASVKRLVICDCSQWRLIENAAQLKKCVNAEIHLWDHHVKGGDITADRTCLEPTVAAVTLLLREIQRREIRLDPHEATLFLLGLYEDSGQLSFDGTSAEDLRAAAFLMDQGGDLAIVTEFLHVAYSDEQKRVLAGLMAEARQYQISGRRIGIGVVQVEQHVNLAVVVQLYARLIDADAVFVIFENPGGGQYIIGRSKSADIDVRRVLEPFGGGGHPGAGSAAVPPGRESAEAVREEVLTELYRASAVGPLVSDMMSFPVTTVPPDLPLEDAARLMRERGIRGLVVEEEGRLTGLVSLWDLKKLTLGKQRRHPVKAFMQREVQTIAPNATVREAAQLMVSRDIGHLPVVLDDRVVGIITRTDIVRYLYGMI